MLVSTCFTIHDLQTEIKQRFVLIMLIMFALAALNTVINVE